MIACALTPLLAQGCGSSATSSSRPAQASPTTAGAPNPATGPSALAAEAQSAATGDIPDNQIFLTYRSLNPGYTMLYPEGWALKGTGADVTIADKNNIVHVVVRTAGVPTAASVTAELEALKRSNPTLTFTVPSVVALKSGPALKTTYSTRSEPNSVTGKSVLLLVDRYELGRGGRRATVDLGTPRGVDNVDAYKKMINSFTWQ